MIPDLKNGVLIRPDQFNFREHEYFAKLEGSVGWKKMKIKKNQAFFYMLGKPCIRIAILHLKRAFKKFVSMLKLT